MLRFSTMRRPGRAPILFIVIVASAVGLLAASSCTTFNGLTLPVADASSSDTALPDTSTADTSPDVDALPDASDIPGYLSISAAARVCSLVFRCPTLASSVITSVAVPVDPINYSLCVHWLAGPIPTDRVGFAVQSQTFSCMAQGATCAAAGTCLSIENLNTGDPRCATVDSGTGGFGVCGDDGGTVFHCESGYLLHCGSAFYAPGAMCLVGDDQHRWCAVGTNCTELAQCTGSLLSYCGEGDNLTQSVNCSYDGYTCDVASNDDSGSPGCNTGTLEKFCSSAGTSCSGAVVEVCDGADISEFDCATLGGTCSVKGGPALCVRSDDQCSPFDADVNVCTGSQIALCVGGRKESFDCASLGMGCIPGGAESGHCG
jgi:hypothetical protein